METLSSIAPEVDTTNPLPEGTRLQEFVIERVIGIGGFGIVYQANDTLLRRTVAIKEFMPTSMALRSEGNTVCLRSASYVKDFETGKETFMDEARMLAQFKHPALIEVLRFWEQNRTAYMVTPFYKGRTLHDFLRAAPGVVNEVELRRILLPVLDALAHMHAAQVYHRDISPDNIMVLQDGTPILLDLGAARRLEELNPRAFTVLVKPGYAPIEQYAGEVSGLQGPWTDLYGWAASAYFALTGKPPPPSASRVMTDTIIKLVELKPAGYSQNFLEAIDATLAVRPDDRPQSVEALKELLVIDGSDSSIQTPSVSVARELPNQEENELASSSSFTPACEPEELPVEPLYLSPAPELKNARPSKTIALIGVCLLSLLAGFWWMIHSDSGQTSPKKAITAVQQPIATAPILSTPFPANPIVVNEKPINEKPANETPLIQTPVTQTPVTQTPANETPVIETTVLDKPAIARLAIKPWGEVVVNGVPKGVSPPLKNLTLPPGEYKMELRNGDYPPYKLTIELKAGQVFNLRHNFEDEAPAMPKPK